MVTAPGHCVLVGIVEVASMPTGASLIKWCGSVIEVAAPHGQPIVLWHGKISSGAAPPEWISRPGGGRARSGARH